MKRFVFVGIPLLFLVLLTWMIALPDDWENWLGFSRYDYFTAGTNYAFTSGPGPMLLAALGYGTIITGLWHAHNCHSDGCWNIGKHRINGTPWCNAHVEEARAVKSVEVLLQEILEELKELRGAS